MSKLKEFFIINGILPIADILFCTNISKWYRRIKKMSSWSPSEIKDWQLDGMKNLIQHAYDNTVYYHELFDSLGLKPNDIKTFEDLEKIPPLTKDIIRERFDDILAINHKDFRYKKSSTGGSTGDPTRYIKDNDSWGFDNAFNIVGWQQTGYRYGDKFLALGSSSIFPTNKKSRLHEYYYRLKGKMPFNAMNLSDEVLERCVDFIVKNDIHYVYGYASSIFLLAKFVKRKNLQSNLDIKACFPTSEILTDVYRETIERVFNCVVIDSYGANDGGIVAHNLKDGFKVGYNCITQILEGGNFGTALLTDVTNMAFPFIRYQLGDKLELDEGYNDFYNGQVLKRVLGRTSDIIELENGRNLTGPGFTILFKDLNVKGYRIFKSNAMEMTIEIVKADNYTKEEEQLIIDTMHKHAGDDCCIVIKYYDDLEFRKNGKSLFFMN